MTANRAEGEARLARPIRGQGPLPQKHSANSSLSPNSGAAVGAVPDREPSRRRGTALQHPFAVKDRSHIKTVPAPGSAPATEPLRERSSTANRAEGEARLARPIRGQGPLPQKHSARSRRAAPATEPLWERSLTANRAEGEEQPGSADSRSRTAPTKTQCQLQPRPRYNAAVGAVPDREPSRRRGTGWQRRFAVEDRSHNNTVPTPASAPLPRRCGSGP